MFFEVPLRRNSHNRVAGAQTVGVMKQDSGTEMNKQNLFRWGHWAAAAGLVGALCAPPAIAKTTTLRVVAPDYWCPFSCVAGSAHEGFAVEIARAALAQQGIKMTYQNMPYDRALYEVRKGTTVDAAIPIMPSEAPDLFFHQVPVSATTYCFYTNDQSSWNFTDIDALEGIQFVATSGYHYGDELMAYVERQRQKGVHLITGSNVPDRMIRMVLGGQYDALLDDSRLVSYVVSRNSYASPLRQAGCLPLLQHGFLALSPALADARELAQRFDEGIRALRSTGELRRILDRYSVDDWQ